MRTICRTVLALILVTTAAHAQATPELGREVPVFNSWPDQAQLDADPAFSGKVMLAIASNPAKRITCRKASVTMDSIACRSRFARKPTIYPREQVVSVLRRAKSEAGILAVQLGLLNGGVGVGTYFLAGVSLYAAVPVAIVFGFFVLYFDALVAACETSPGDRLLYQQPGTKVVGWISSGDC